VSETSILLREGCERSGVRLADLHIHSIRARASERTRLAYSRIKSYDAGAATLSESTMGRVAANCWTYMTEFHEQCQESKTDMTAGRLLPGRLVQPRTFQNPRAS
jgi:hypothetical protein